MFITQDTVNGITQDRPSGLNSGRLADIVKYFFDGFLGPLLALSASSVELADDVALVST